jgi:hypothetical protein
MFCQLLMLRLILAALALVGQQFEPAALLMAQILLRSLAQLATTCSSALALPGHRSSSSLVVVKECGSLLVVKLVSV